MKFSNKVSVLLLCLVIMTPALWLPSPGLAGSLPEYRIKISFDLDENKIFGTVEAILPKSVREIMVGSGLGITKFTINGETAKAEVKEGRILLPFHRRPIKVQMEYQGVFSNKKRESFANTIGNEGAFLLSDWYPAAEAELAHFFLQAKIPKGFHGVSEADNITVQDMGKEKLLTFDFPHPVAHIHFIMAPFVVNKDQYGGVELETYLLPEDQNLADRYLSFTKKYLEMYEDILGPYPFKRFAVVENILPTGYGMPTFTLLGRQVLKLPFIPETSLGHEILHSWFGNSVYVDYEKGNWSEGLTSYLADHYYEELQGKGWQYRRKILEDYESYVHGENEISVQDFFSGDDRALRAVGYGKTAMLFHMLKNRMGNKRFEEALRQLAKNQRFRLTSWRDLEEIFSKTAGENLEEFFEFWLESKGAIAINLGKTRVNQSTGGYNLEFSIQVRNSPMPLSIPVVIRTGAKEEKKILSLSGARQDFSLSMKERPKEIVIDPNYELFRTLKQTERRAVFSRLLGDPTRTVVLPETNRNIYEPFIQELENRGFEKLAAHEVDHSNMAQRAFLFLGTQEGLKSLFPGSPATPEGFSIEIKKNGFNPNLVLGLALAENSTEVSGVIPRLFHYGKYSSLKFSKGRAMEKEIEKSDRGIRHEVASPVTGVALKSVLNLPEIVSQVADKTIVYVGEKHDRYGDHLTQLEVIRHLHRLHPKLAIGMEMFQRRYQKALDEYIFGDTDTATFLKNSRYFSTWRFNYHLYEDILNYAREHKIPIVALNQDHELVGKVADQGLDQLSQEEKNRIPKEMALDDENYKERLRRVFEMHQTELAGDKGPRDFEYFHQAQILWDETMAETIASFLTERPDYHLVVLAGNGHLAYGSGIPKRAYRRTGKDYAIVLPDPGELLEPGVADFIVFPSELDAPEDAKLGVMLDTSGDQLEVAGLVKGGGAQKAGLEKGDIILFVDGHGVKSIDDLKAYLATKYVGDWIQVKVRRDKKKLELRVELGSPVPHRR